MTRRILLFILIFAFGITAGYFVVSKFWPNKKLEKDINLTSLFGPQKEVVGFLPYWLLSKAQTDYSKYITQLSYFSLTVSPDGTIEQYTAPGESEPGYLALKRGKADPFLNSAKANGVNLSLTVFNGNDDQIGQILSDPTKNADNLVGSVAPIMQQYGFTDLNLDIEQVSDASPSARANFVNFTKEVKNQLVARKLGTLTLDMTAISFVKDTNLSDPKALAQIADKIILMAYDYHYSGSYVTGPVAPGEGAGVVSEFDTESAVEKALEIMPASKLILGIPLYGYEWETINDTPRSAVIPHTGLIISNQRAENFLASCATCSAQFDDTDKEVHVIYKDQETGTYHQIFYPDGQSTGYKVSLANNNSLGGIAVWALGYEGQTILGPLSSYGH